MSDRSNSCAAVDGPAPDACPYCNGPIRAYHGHVAGRCSWLDDINALLRDIRAAAFAQRSPRGTP